MRRRAGTAPLLLVPHSVFAAPFYVIRTLAALDPTLLLLRGIIKRHHAPKVGAVPL